MKEVLLFITIMLFCLSSIQAQVTFPKRIGNSVGNAPQVSDIDIPASLDHVEHITGTLKVSIPLYEIKTSDITIPITLNFSAQGARVNEPHSFVGRGWVLNTGGKISKKVNGLPDGYLGNTATYDMGNLSQEIGFYKNMIQGNADGAEDILNISTPSGSYKTCKNLVSPYKADLSPDGIQYKFRSTVTTQYAPSRYYRYNSSSKKLDWVGYGRQYFLMDSYSYPSPYASELGLDSVISTRYKDTVTYHYKEPGYFDWKTVEYRATESIPYKRDVEYDLWEDSYNSLQFTKVIRDGYAAQSRSVSENRLAMAYKKLDHINFKGGRVVFVYDESNGPDSLLRELIIQRGTYPDYETLKSFKFNYGTAPVLNEIVVTDQLNDKVYSWKLDYYTSASPVPENPFAQDHWGFYNGKNNKTLLSSPFTHPYLQAYNIQVQEGGTVIDNVPAHNFYVNTGLIQGPILNQGDLPADPSYRKFVGYANREYDFESARTLMLKSIITPTGAIVNYTYEPHTYLSMGERKQGGGIRIKGISWMKAAGNYGKQFTYEDGTVQLPLNFLKVTDLYAASGSGSHQFSVDNYTQFSHPVNNLDMYNGSCAMYTQITEHLYTFLGKKGKTVYLFDPKEAFPGAYGADFPSFYAESGFANTTYWDTPRRVDYYETLTDKISTTDYDRPVKTVENEVAAFSGNTPNATLNFYAVTGQLFGTLAPVVELLNFRIYDSACRCYRLRDPSLPTYEFGTNPYLEVDAALEHNAEDISPYFPGKYATYSVNLKPEEVNYKLIKTSTTLYGTKGHHPISSETVEYTYGNPLVHLYPTKISVSGLSGNRSTQYNRYAADFASLSSAHPIAKLRTKGSNSELIEQINARSKDGQEIIIGGNINSWRESEGLIVKDKIYTLNTNNNLVPYSSYLHYDGAATDPHYEESGSWDVYDSKGNVLQSSQFRGPKTSIVYDDKKIYPIAEIKNAPHSQVLINDFEATATGFSTGGVKDYTKVYTGYVSLKIAGNASASTACQSTAQISAGSGTSKVLYSGWVYSDGPASGIELLGAAGTGAAYSVIDNAETSETGKWVYLEKKFELPANIGSLTLRLKNKGTGNVWFDNIRLYPASAQLKTFTYNPLIGISSIMDAKGMTSHYEYDYFLRLSQILDKDKNILKQLEYNYAH